jgi:Sec-independent protein translocase protein TatA
VKVMGLSFMADARAGTRPRRPVLGLGSLGLALPGSLVGDAIRNFKKQSEKVTDEIEKATEPAADEGKAPLIEQASTAAKVADEAPRKGQSKAPKA